MADPKRLKLWDEVQRQKLIPSSSIAKIDEATMSEPKERSLSLTYLDVDQLRGTLTEVIFNLQQFAEQNNQKYIRDTKSFQHQIGQQIKSLKEMLQTIEPQVRDDELHGKMDKLIGMVADYDVISKLQKENLELEREAIVALINYIKRFS